VWVGASLKSPIPLVHFRPEPETKNIQIWPLRVTMSGSMLLLKQRNTQRSAACQTSSAASACNNLQPLRAFKKNQE